MKNTKEKILKALKGEQEIVINKCFGGFGLSNKAIMRYAELKGIKLFTWIDDITKKVYKEKAKIDNPQIILHYATKDVKDETDYQKKGGDNIYWSERDIKRDDEELVQVVKELGNKANGTHSKLEVVKIPSGVEWEISNYDGMETINEVHRSWG